VSIDGFIQSLFMKEDPSFEHFKSKLGPMMNENEMRSVAAILWKHEREITVNDFNDLITDYSTLYSGLPDDDYDDVAWTLVMYKEEIDEEIRKANNLKRLAEFDKMRDRGEIVGPNLLGDITKNYLTREEENEVIKKVYFDKTSNSSDWNEDMLHHQINYRDRDLTNLYGLVLQDLDRPLVEEFNDIMDTTDISDDERYKLGMDFFDIKSGENIRFELSYFKDTVNENMDISADYILKAIIQTRRNTTKLMDEEQKKRRYGERSHINSGNTQRRSTPPEKGDGINRRDEYNRQLDIALSNDLIYSFENEIKLEKEMLRNYKIQDNEIPIYVSELLNTSFNLEIFDPHHDTEPITTNGAATILKPLRKEVNFNDVNMYSFEDEIKLEKEMLRNYKIQDNKIPSYVFEPLNTSVNLEMFDPHQGIEPITTGGAAIIVKPLRKEVNSNEVNMYSFKDEIKLEKEMLRNYKRQLNKKPKITNGAATVVKPSKKEVYSNDMTASIMHFECARQLLKGLKAAQLTQ